MTQKTLRPRQPLPCLLGPGPHLPAWGRRAPGKSPWTAPPSSPRGAASPPTGAPWGGAAVLDVQEVGGAILHTTTDAPLTPGTTVQGTLDWPPPALAGCSATPGEHVISGLAHSLYGRTNVGFHMTGSDPKWEALENACQPDRPPGQHCSVRPAENATAGIWEVRCRLYVSFG